MNSVIVDSQKVTPNKIICIGRNYVEHIAELGNEVPDEMVVFLKPNSSITSQLISYHHEQLHYEGEICFVYQEGRFSAVGFGLDLTKRSLQSKLKAKGLPWERAKAFDGSAVFSKFVLIDAVQPDLQLQLTINEKIIQQGGVELMMFKPNEILQELQTFMTLDDGDIVMTGTPKGVGIINQGDVFEGKIIIDKQCVVSEIWSSQ
ncbi:MAG: fumarylacetoacetate hydrolase family protein [Colwelliaceae bacterium]|nr:fumarylacetoacetate hydrolase family protein [Colwelliaceae bacterium]